MSTVRSGSGIRSFARCLPFALLAIVGWSPANADSLSVQQAVEWVQALRGGGYNIYFRHAQTDWSQSDHVNAAGDWTSCDAARMRQLAAEGRRTSIAIGEAIRSLGIPIGRVLASPYCRTVQTATLMDVGPVETTTDIMNLRAEHFFGGRDAIVRSARARLASVPASGTNSVLVAHGNVAREATPVYPGEGEGVVFKPDGQGSFTVFARIKAEHWDTLLETLAQ